MEFDLKSPGILRAVLFVMVAVSALTGCTNGARSDSAEAPGTPTKVSTTTEAGNTEASPPPNSLRFGPRGAGPLRLGMSAKQVAATGAAKALAVGGGHDGWPAGCWLVRYRASELGRVPHGATNGVVSRRHGLESIYATTRMVTPEGIGIGSSLNQVRSAYHRPDLQRGDLVTIRASGDIVYRIQLLRRVTSIALQYQRLDCHH